MTKYIVIILFSLLCVDGCWAQQITLKFIGSVEEKINLGIYSVEFDDDIVLSANDNLKIIKTEKPTAVFCYDHHRRTYIYAEPNDTIEINLSQEGLIEYSCKTNKFRKLESEFINQCHEKYGSMEPSVVKEMINSINRPNLSQYIDPKYIKEQEMLMSFYKDNMVSKGFYDYFMAVYWYLTLSNELEISPIPKEIISKIESTYDKAEDYLGFQQYRDLLDIYTQNAMKELGIAPDLPNKLKFIISHYKNQKIKDYLLYREMEMFLSNHHETKSVDDTTIQLFRENCKNKIFLDEVNKDLEPPTTPVFIENIIKKHAGKLVLVDFWASWCMPCREEFPHEKKLIKKYPEVAFVFISIDKSNAAWERASKEYPDMLNKDNNYLLLKSVQDELLNQINLSTIPRFVLFNKNGEIINVDAPRPSSKEIETLIEKYL